MLWSVEWIELLVCSHLYTCVLHAFMARLFPFDSLFQVKLFGEGFLSIMLDEVAVTREGSRTYHGTSSACI